MAATYNVTRKHNNPIPVGTLLNLIAQVSLMALFPPIHTLLIITHMNYTMAHIQGEIM